MKEFEEVYIEIIAYSIEDVIATSDGLEAIGSGFDQED